MSKSAHVRLNVTQARRGSDTLDRPVQLIIAPLDRQGHIDLSASDAVALAQDLVRVAELAESTAPPAEKEEPF